MVSKKFQTEFAKLNKEQKEAVEEIEGPVMVIAGPGTGKTQILAMRIANILNKTQVNPSNILCLTFTNSGVYAMRKRLLEIIGKSSYAVHVHTFHSFCNEVIQAFPEKFLFAKEINQLTDFEQIKLIQKIIDKLTLKRLKPLKSPYYYQRDILQSIGDLKQEAITPEKFLKFLKDEKDKLILEKNSDLAKIYKAYQDELTTKGLYDFNDMILFVVEMLKNDTELLSFYQEKFQYILVDEYQDTNSAQNEIIQILGSFYPEPNIFVVGDDEQSIFRFQGASLENILFFKQIYPNSQVIVLEKNYRSGQKILDVSRKLISNNKKQIFNLLKIEKNLKSELKSTRGEIHTGEFSTEEVENYFVAKTIEEKTKKGTKPSEIAVIYKEHRDAENLIDLLSKLNIPYQLEIGGDILDDLEIGKIIRLLNVISAPEKRENSENIFEVLHFPFWKIDELNLYKLLKYSNHNRKDMFDVILSEDDLKDAGIKNQKSILDFGGKILECADYFINHTFADSFEHALESTGFLNYLLKLPESVQHLNRLQSLFDEIQIINRKNKSLKLSEFLEYLDELKKNNLEIKEKALDIDYEGVKLITSHKAKGQEYEIVFILKCVDEHWGNKTRKKLIKLPSGFLLTKNLVDDNSEEERRLFYVALTRAKKEIYLTYALNYGIGESTKLKMPSQFLSELPNEALNQIDTKRFEKNFTERMKLKFSPRVWKPRKALKEFIIELINDFSLSPTSLNAYLDCPQSFFYNQLLKVPKVKDFGQCYGTAVHKALEMFFKKFSRDYELPAKKELLDFYDSALENEILKPQDYKRAQIDGQKNLGNYYDFYKLHWKKSAPPINVEYNFGSHNVHFESIPITGKIDKIEVIDSIGKTVRITDYKTSQPKSLNQMSGKTSEENFKELYQAYFYKLLSENDPQFSWKITEIEFDFLSPKDGKFKKVSVPIDKTEYDKFKNLAKEVYNDIKKLKFKPSQDKKACQKYGFKCEYFDLCKKN